MKSLTSSIVVSLTILFVLTKYCNLLMLYDSPFEIIREVRWAHIVKYQIKVE